MRYTDIWAKSRYCLAAVYSQVLTNVVDLTISLTDVRQIRYLILSNHT